MPEAVVWLIVAVVAWLLLVVALGIGGNLIELWAARRLGVDPGERRLFWLRRLVAVLEWACGVIDRIPWWLRSWNPLRWLGCPRGMALWAMRLDERWRTGVWGRPGDGNASDGAPVAAASDPETDGGRADG